MRPDGAEVQYDRQFEFQSTHPHGVRRTNEEITAREALFQSTHPHGVRRGKAVEIYDSIDVSIHAPTRGATDFNNDYSREDYGFNPRTHTGCDK